MDYIVHQAPLSMKFSKQEYWSGNPHFLHPGIFPTQESNPRLLHWQANSLPLSHLGSPEKGNDKYLIYSKTAKGGRDGRGEEKKEARTMAVVLISETCRV